MEKACIPVQKRTMKSGDVVLLENTRFHEGEKKNDPGFAERLARGYDIFVKDAFAAVHRAHASTAGVAAHLPAEAGFLMQREMEALERRCGKNRGTLSSSSWAERRSPTRSGFWITSAHGRTTYVVGGGMADTLLLGKGLNVGESLVEEDCLDEARRILEKAGERLVLPVDVVVAESREESGNHCTVPVENVPEDWQILDLGRETAVPLAGAGSSGSVSTRRKE